MKTYRLTVAALSLIGALVAANVQAEGDSPRSRADVVAEVLAARAAGTLGVLAGEDAGSFHMLREPSTSRPRADVVAELAEWRTSGAMAAFRAEFEGLVSQGSTMPPSTLTRAEVRAQVLAARASGELDAYAGDDSGSFHLARVEAAQAAAYAAKQRVNGLIATR